MFVLEELKDLLGFLKLGNEKRKLEIVVISGAGISAASGIRTFRDNDGLWEEYDVYDVATPEAWAANPELVQRFYNERRKQLLSVKPNGGHLAIADLEEIANVTIVTQNVDDLHERGGSSNVLHLHGELKKAQSSINADLIYDIDGWELKMGDLCALGSQLRPHVVWFGEAVPKMVEAEILVEKADLVIVVGTSLNVYPAAGLLYNVNRDVPLVVVDPSEMNLKAWPNAMHWKAKAEDALPQFKDYLIHILK